MRYRYVSKTGNLAKELAVITGISKQANMAFHPVRVGLMLIHWTSRQYANTTSKD